MPIIQGRLQPTLDLGEVGDAKAEPVALPPITVPRICEQPVLEAQALIDRAGLDNLIPLLRIKMGFPAEVFALAARPLIAGYAEFVQLLPVAGSRRYAEPGGQLHRALATALRALDYRRGQILPRGAAPEIIGAHAHRWTYAVFAAALLRDAGRAHAGVRVWTDADSDTPALWNPVPYSILVRRAARYRIEPLSREAPSGVAEATVPLRIFERCAPPIVQAWLGEDDALMAELRAVLAGTADMAGAIAGLVERAAIGSDRASITLSAPEPQPVPPAVEPSTDPAPADPSQVEPEFLEHVETQGSQIARRFMDWLRQGILSGTLPVNAPGAPVHVVAEGLLLASPRIFREFVRQCAAGLAEATPGLDRSGDVGRQVQREVLRAGWHLRADRGVNVLAYELRRGDRGTARINGIVIRAPERFVDPLPAINPSLVRLSDAAGIAD